MRPLHAFRKTVAILGIALGIAVALCFVPEDPYQRWQLLDGTIHANARWIYERIHDDPAPIDVVFVGPSRIERGVNAPRLAADLAAQGLPSNVVNFSLPEAGRDINFVIVNELLKSKRPKLIVIGVTEKPSRFGHPAFKFLADAHQVVAPGYLSDLSYFSDLAYLPYRKAELLAADLAPGILGPSTNFDAVSYRGHSVDTTGSVHLPDGTIKDGEHPAPRAELTRGVRKLERGMHAPILPARYADLEFGDERTNVRRIAQLAKGKGVQIAFLFLPYYTGPSTIQEAVFYRRYGPIWNAGYLAQDSTIFMDYGHLTRSGAIGLTDWLVKPVADELKTAVGEP
jgi:hypothetical protein